MREEANGPPHEVVDRGVLEARDHGVADLSPSDEERLLMARELKIGKVGRRAFNLPLDAVNQKIGFLGRTGSGKSYAAMKVAGEMLDAGAHVVILDVVGVWWGLRLAADGKSQGVEVPVIGGLCGDIPLAPTAGALMANLIADRRLSVVLDLSQFETDKAKARFAAEFADRLFRRQKAAPSPVHIFLEECQEFIPQNIQKGQGEEMMLHHWTRIAKLGRNFGIGLSLISQRPQEVNKKALNMTECLFAFQMTGTHERKAIRDWLGSKGSEHSDDDIRDVLRKLPVGTAHVSSPQWLQFEGLVAISEKRTFDSSSTPSFADVGRMQAHELAPLDLDELQASMADTIEQAEANDPKTLKKRVAQLQADLRDALARTGPDPDELVEERDRYVMAALKEQRQRFDVVLRSVMAAGDELQKQASKTVDELAGVNDTRLELLEDDDGDVDLIDAGDKVAPPPRRLAVPPPPPAAPLPPPSSNGSVTGPQQKILDALATYESFGAPEVARTAAVAFAGYKSGGHINNVLGQLRTDGLIVYPRGAHLSLTPHGRVHARARVIHSVADIHRAWFDLASGPQRKVLEVLIDRWPGDVGRDELAHATSYSSGGHFNNVLGSLKTLGAATYPSPGRIAASELLFPTGLH